MTAAPSAPGLPGRHPLMIAVRYANEAPRLYRTKVLLQAVELAKHPDDPRLVLHFETRHTFSSGCSECPAKPFKSVCCVVVIIAINRLFKYDDPLDAQLPRTVLVSWCPHLVRVRRR